MYRKVEDFVRDWNVSSAGTLNVFKAMTNDKLDQAIVEGHNSLGWLAWHLVGAAGGLGHFAGLNIPGPSREEPVPTDVAEIVEAYEKIINSYQEETAKLTDESLLEEVTGFAGPTPRGTLLRALIDHQTHHRGQMTVLLRQAGLSVPPIMGPTKERQ
ncbi:DinB family protein [Lederbergia wuyishanensis]|uniref:Damage-inducible protein DinB n=1 Tax=Lederbergia wuyishanensis TaxID=1347903 RepID=A0ABU0D6Y5_9BACI|nr:DinB family protein [Lederbergia wuyishanensis]MCJ8008855.1 DinB family protein [Lederbergia wuyishanensis]MDQ0344177.1 putative damage-inducible protein DinB [Lederbergia wuyishanensis]